MKKSLIALAFGTLGLGIAEFVMMGILPDVARDLKISIPAAGHFISAYALGVCVGAPVLTLARKYPLKHILLVLVTLIMVGNICAALSPNYWMLLISRFISGLPHGAYFGVGSIVAERLADKGKSSEAVSIMIAGMTIANLFGVPLGTSLSTMLSWRATFLLVGLWGIVILYYIWRWVPQVEGLKDTGFKGQFRFLKTPAPWLILGATALGNGGVFCWYSYINPMLTHISGFSAESITPLMILAGFGMVMGNLISGRLSDRYTPGKVGTAAQALPDAVAYLLPFSLQMGGCAIDVPLHRRTVCRIQSGTDIDYPCSQRRRNARSCLCTGSVQSGKCHRSLCRRTGNQRRLPLSRPDGCSVRIDRLHPFPDLL